MVFSWLQEQDVNRLIARGQYGRAVKVLEGQLARDPDSIHLRQQLADVLVRDDQKARAVELLEEVARHYVEDGFLAKAIAMAKKIQRVDPGKADGEGMLDILAEAKEDKSEGDRPAADRSPADPAARLAEAPSPAEMLASGEGDYRATSQILLSEVWFEAAAERRDDFNWSPLFRDFSRSELAALVGSLRLLVKQPGSIIFSEGEPGNSLFVLASGSARVYRRDDVGHNDQIAVLMEGEIFGAPSVLEGEPRTVTVTAITECELLELHGEIFEDITETFPRIRELVEEIHANRAT